MLNFYLSLIDDYDKRNKFEELYFTYRQDMYKTAFGILNDSFEAEDSVHEAFMIIINKLDKISEVKCPQTHAYLIIIVKNLALKLYNKRKKTTAEDIDDIDVADVTDVENEVLSAIGLEQLEKILVQLPENYYNVLYLEQYMGLSIADISESLGITYENAKKRLQRAKNQFRQMIKECPDDEI